MSVSKELKKISDMPKAAEGTSAEDKKVVKTCDMFVDMLDKKDGCEHTLIKCFPAKIVVLKDDGSGWARDLDGLRNVDGIAYLLDTEYGKRIAQINNDGTYLVFPVGEYRNEYVWHIVKAENGSVTLEETDLWEDAHCAELGWRIAWEEQLKQSAALLQNEIWKMLFGK